MYVLTLVWLICVVCDRQCHKQAGCRWCSVGEDGIDLGDKSFCGEVQVCHFGMVGHYGLLHGRCCMYTQRVAQVNVVGANTANTTMFIVVMCH